MTRKAIFIIAALIAVMLLIGCVSAAQQITISPVTMNAGGTGTATITLDSAPTGLSAYKITLHINNPAVADQITQVSYPSGFNSFDTNGIYTNPCTVAFSNGYVKAGDLTGTSFPDGTTNIQLATITLHGLSAGTTTITATLNRLDDNYGGDYVPTTTINNPTVTVTGPPTAAFAVSTNNTYVNMPITFTDQSTGSPTSWAWTFGDGNTSIAQNPVYAYPNAGTYTVSLTATNGVGSNTLTKTGYMVINTVPAPVAAFSTSATNGLAPVTATFTDTSTNTPTSWLWQERIADNGAWTTFSTSQNPSFTATTAGTYDIRLTATNAGGSNNVTKTHVFSAATAHAYLTTVGSSDVSGDVYVNSVSPFTTTATQTFTLPAAAVGNVQWARLYVDTYSGSATGSYGLTSVVALGSTTLGTETLNVGAQTNGNAYPVNDHVMKVYSDYEAVYDVTSLITTASPTVTVTNSALSGYSFDGRIKGITLVVAYNDGDSDHVRYIVNHGSDWMGPAGATSSTMFDASSFPAGWTSASMKTVAHSSTEGTYKLNGAGITPTSLLSGSYIKYNQFDLTSTLTPASTNTVGFAAVGSSLKMTTAVLKVRYVTPPTAAFIVSGAGSTSTNPAAINTAVTFDRSASTIPATSGTTTYAWAFGDGATSSGSTATVTHTYSAAGTYTATLTITNEGGSTTDTKLVYVTNKPIISFFPASQTFNPSETATYVIQMDRAPTGLAGYDMVVSLSNGAPADITSVTYPTWAGLTLNPTVPSDSVHIGAVDTQQQIYPGTTGPYTLATITVKGVAAGSTNLVMSSVNMDDDSGNVIGPNADAVGVANIGTYSGPTASFTGTPLSGNAPLTVGFDSSASTGTITTHQWDFGDSTTSSDANPTHIYTAIGTYNVKLVVSGPGGSNTMLRNAYVTVGDGVAPTAAITATPTTGNYPLKVSFAATTTGNVASYAWNFGDGTYSTLAAPNHTYTYPGDFTASLVVTGTGGSSAPATVIIHATQNAPVAGIVATPTSGTSPLLVQFTDASTGSITSYNWSFGDGTAYDATANPSHTYTSAGVYTVTHFVTGPGGQSTPVTTTITVTGLSVDFVAGSTTGVASANHGFTTTFTSTANPGATSYLWDFGDGTTSTDANPSHTYYGRLNSFTVTLTVHNGADVASVTKTGYITTTPYLKAFPKYDTTGTITGYYSLIPADLNGDYVYEDINHNGRVDYDDVVAFYDAYTYGWIAAQTDVDQVNFDYSGNGALGYQDVNALNDLVLYH